MCVGSLTLSSEQAGLQQLRHVLGLQQQLRKVALGQDQAQQWEELVGACTLPCGGWERKFQAPLGPRVRVHSLS